MGMGHLQQISEEKRHDSPAKILQKSNFMSK
ncbi:unnamed protein product [Spirodela intermedia]|uniref:Uncharacterized protein n=1 Tax=Spirodela intermedia TaxID=51605 RepID=A0A7I8KHQ1_SPIIN|nr:unnamed protein product [Spirodela intermedia]